MNLAPDASVQRGDAFLAVNPAGLVPVLLIDDLVLTQSLAICEYLEDTRPQPALLPADPAAKAWVRALALDIACDIHPINNLRVQQRLRHELGAGDAEVFSWMDHWMRTGFTGIERRLAASPVSGPCCLGQMPGLADIFLVAQVYNAERFETDMSGFGRIMAVVEHCRRLPAFAAASPEAQPDAPQA